MSGTIINDSSSNNLNNILGIGTFLSNENDPETKKSNLNSIINETKYQINKCITLLIECEREPRKKFILDFDEVYWLNF